MTQAQKKWTTFLIVAISAALVYGVVFSWIARAQAAEVKTEKSFTESEWAPELLKQKDQELLLLPVDFKATLKPFPAYGSDEEKQEIAILKYLSNLRFAEDVAEINAENTAGSTLDVFAARKLFDAKSKPETQKLVAAALYDASIITLREKYDFKRLRPSQIEPSLDLMFPYPPHAAYPSGHATQAMVTGLILAALDPAKSKDYLDLAKSIGRHREMAGIHYPSDTDAGFALAGQILEALGRSEKYKVMFGAAAQEFKV